jgi:hypothetical protein
MLASSAIALPPAAWISAATRSQAVEVYVKYADGHAFGREPNCAGTANSGGCAGDECCLCH